jgi:hypothetical protein
MKTFPLPLLLLLPLLAAGLRAPAEDKPLYTQDFDALKELPEDIMQLNGEFTLVAEGTGKAMALTPNPLDTYNCLFGPPAKDGIAARARIQGASKGRQSPSFGIGLNGVSGYVLRLATAKGQIELVHDEAVLTSQPYAWKSGSWTRFLLQVRALTPTSWAVEGKIWPDGQAEPAAWTLATTIDKAPSPGRASLWGVPYGGKPLLFDDLVVAPASAK